ncbi:MAG TPA: hypothetical protein VN604_02780 [Nitrospirota bacterium]|nr:hypothetical protein [Nitrospirota bacterium]
MRAIRGNRSFSLVTLGLLVFILLSCAPKKPPYEISNNYSKQNYKRVALLVVRVGNLSRVGCPVPVTLDTDYSVRTPQVGSTFLQYPAKVDVYIEDEDRLRQSLPAYPDYPMHGFTEKVKYYKNITPQIYKAVSGLLTRKGYQVVNVQEAAASWPKKVSEMKVVEIVDALKKDADAVLVLHYADLGYYYGSAGGVSNEIKGFVELNYVAAMFDANTKERLVYYKFDGPYLDTIPRVVSQDPFIKGDPELAKKVKIEGKRGYSYRYAASLSFTEDEIIDFVMRYLCKGVAIGETEESSWKWVGLDEIIP